MALEKTQFFKGTALSRHMPFAQGRHKEPDRRGEAKTGGGACKARPMVQVIGHLYRGSPARPDLWQAPHLTPGTTRRACRLSHMSWRVCRVRMFASTPPNLSLKGMTRRIKGCASRHTQMACPELCTRFRRRRLGSVRILFDTARIYNRRDPYFHFRYPELGYPGRHPRNGWPRPKADQRPVAGHFQ